MTSLTVACIDFFDRTRPLVEGRVVGTLPTLQCIALPPRELDERFIDFDVAEVALGTYALLRASGDDQHVALPIFPYRSYFLSNVIVSTESGIEHPSDLPGSLVATGGLHLSGTIWTRGILEDLYDIDTNEINWISRRSEAGTIRAKLVEITQRGAPNLELVSDDTLIATELTSGRIDAWIGPSLPGDITPTTPGVRRLFPEYEMIEDDFASDTRIFPPIHLIVVRREIVQEVPRISEQLIAHFQSSRELGLLDLYNDGLFACGIPHLRHRIEHMIHTFGGDPYMPGLAAANRSALHRFLDYLSRQTVLSRNLNFEELFEEVVENEAG